MRINVAYKPFLLLLVSVILTPVWLNLRTPVWLNLRTPLTLHSPKEEVTAVEDLLSLPSLHTKGQQIISSSSSAITTEKYDDPAMALPGTVATTTARRTDGTFHFNITVIIGTCNRLHSLQDAIESALAQSYPVFEVIVAIDSGNGCVQDIKNIWQPRDNRVRVLKLPPCPTGNKCGNGGRTRKYAIDRASPHTTHFAILDDDDVWYYNKTKLQVILMYEGNYSISSSDANKPTRSRCKKSIYVSHDLLRERYYLMNGGIHKKHIFRRMHINDDQNLPSHVERANLKLHNIFITSATMFSKDLYTLSSGFDDTLPNGQEDYDLWLKLLKIGPAVYHTNPLVVYDNQRNKCDIQSTSPLYVVSIDGASREPEDENMEPEEEEAAAVEPAKKKKSQNWKKKNKKKNKKKKKQQQKEEEGVW